MDMIIYVAILWALLFLPSYLLMSLRRKMLNLTYGAVDCDPALLVSAACPPIGILFALADITAFKLGLREPGRYFNGEACRK